jgi:hypothetical protein
MIPSPKPGETSLQRLARVFEIFADHETIRTSPLYTRLILATANDEDLLELASHSRRTPVPNMLLGAVHYLLLKGAQHPLAEYYPSVVGAQARTDDVLPAFKAFCRDYRDEIIQQLHTRIVQTNEVNRCGLWLPAFNLIAQREPGGRALGLVEIGPSAGLNLLWDHYRYEYGNGYSAGYVDAPLRLTLALRGGTIPPLPETLPVVGSRIGLDLNPVDVRDEDAALWLRALVWPEHSERAERLAQATAIAQQHSPQLFAGDALKDLPDVLARVPDDQVLCVYHSFVINQFSHDGREQFNALLAEQSAHRTIYRLSMEWLHTPETQLELRVYQGGAEVEHTLLAYVESHGRWLQWL